MTAPSLERRPPPVLEREEEIGRLHDAVADARRGFGRAVIVEGAPGIGKSTLVRAVVARAQVEGVRTLEARGSSLERQYAYGIAVRLFERLFVDGSIDRDALVRGPAAAAASLFENRGDGDGWRDPFSTVHALYWLTVNAADAGPLLLAVDDAQWADEASLRFLHYLAQRIEDLPVLLVLGLRDAADVSPGTVADVLRAEPTATHIAPAPLSEEAIAQLLAAHGSPTDPALARACLAATGGNPFYVTELIRNDLTALATNSVAVDGQPATASFAPDAVRRAIRSRLARMDEAASRLAEAVAILGEEATLPRAAELAGIEDAAAADLAGELVRASILDPASDRLSFVHPIVEAAIGQSIPRVVRDRLRRTAADVLLRRHAPVGAIAAQLLEAEHRHDAKVVAVLCEAAREAIARGDAAVALTLLERALAEPPSDAQRPDVLVDLARAQAAVAPGEAPARFERALEVIGDSRTRATLLLELGHAQVAASAFATASSTFERGLAELAESADDPDASASDELQNRLEAGFIAAAWVSMERRSQVDAAVARVLGRDVLGPVQRELAIWIAFQRTVGVKAAAPEMLELVRRAVSEVTIPALVTEGQAVEVAAGTLLATDALDLEIQLLTEALAAVREAGTYAKVGTYSYCRAWPYYYMGRLTDSVADAQAAVRASELGWETFYPATCAVLGQALIELGELDAAARALAIDDGRWSQRVDFALLVPLARAKLELARGRPDLALPLVEAASIGPTAAGLENSVPTDWRSTMTTTLVRLGRHEEARAVADGGLEIARRWGAEWPLGVALRVAGLAHGGRAGLEMLEESVDRLEVSPARLEHLRALVDLGAALRREGRVVAARDRLREAMDLAHRLGARTLQERSRDELIAAGTRPRRYLRSGVQALTPSELRVARLAADGRTNREIAQDLFVTPKAVEFHLANAYRKLEIGSRQELGRALGAGPAASASEATSTA
jgi:DNA-binding CsgD family transcriptional regulator